ncbi:MAG: hypothetical protein P4M11_09760 [Candidatus Pacebacteria bacterium]|nr:hypothetical protein [Candidatus Paceibacterota bacterium]
MKQLLAGIVLILIIGIAGFLYRNEVERPLGVAPIVLGGTACTQEAKICPDGSAVGRTGPNCSFAACPLPNAEIVIGSTTLDFVLPAGYQKSSIPNQAPLIASYSQAGSSGSAINVYEYPIPAGGSPDQVMIANTTFDPSGLQATSTSQFHQVTAGKNTFSVAQIGRFEGQVQTAYYLPLANSILRFDIVERNVTNWTDPSLDPSSLPEHRAFLQMLGTLEASGS